ncbi:MAG: GGDEF domain-containing protein [Chloroflexi bacterium]|nr:GGDEF domain-containing protein [Chloroflexota bacterium]
MADIISEHGLEALLGHIHAMAVLLESDGQLISWNPAFDECKKTSPSTSNLRGFFSKKDTRLFETHLELKTQNRWFAELAVEAERYLHYDCLLIPVPEDRFLFIAEPVKMDSATREIIERLNRQVKLFKIESEFAKKIARNKQVEMEGVMVQANEVAQVDALTFLLNRRMIVWKLQDEILRANRYNTPFSISLVDIDHFKKINDVYGHLAGDEVLRQVAYQLRDHIRHPDVVGRYGGEEFLILLPNSKSTAAIEQAGRLSKQIRGTPIDVNEQIINITISIGIAELQPGVDTWETLLKRADTAMYEAKRNGRDRWAVAE